MARNVQLLELVDQLRHETGKSTVAGVGTDDLPTLKYLIKRTQDNLYLKHDWPHLMVKPTITLAAGSRYYDIPADIALETIDESVIFYNNRKVPLPRGIDFGFYNVYDPEQDQRSDPARAWDIVWTGSKEQVEVWPLPASNGSKIYFKGKRPLRALIADADVCDLDDQLIVLHCAAELLARSGDKDARAKAGLAQERLVTLKGRVKGGTKAPLIMGGASPEPQERLRAHYNPNAGA